MSVIQRLRTIANRVFQRQAENDNNPLHFTVSKKERLRAGNPPMDNAVVETLHGIKVSDPFRPLENLDAPETAAWLQAQNRAFNDYISANDESMKAATEFLTDALNYDSIGLPSRYGEKYFRTYHKALAAQSRIEVADSKEGPWRTLLDPNTFSADGTVALSGWTPSHDGSRIAYRVSEAGSDAQTLKVLDVNTGKDLPDVIEGCRFVSVRWDRKSNDGFLYTYPVNDGSRRFTIKHHAIGTDIAQDKEIFDPGVENAFVAPGRLSTAKYEWVYVRLGSDSNTSLLYRPFGSQDAFTEIVPPKTCSISPLAELEDGTVLATTNMNAPRGRLVKFDPKNPAPENWQTIIPEHDVDILDSAMLHKGKLFGFYTHDTADAVRVFTPEGQHLHDMPLPVQSTAGYARINDEDDTFTLKISGFQSAGDTYTYDIAGNTLTFTEKGPAKYDMNDCIVERLHATSKDGTQVPMTVIRRPDVELDGTAATKLYGYGGFNVPLSPGFSTMVMQFVKAGGIYVQTNLRGGGEYGEKWYEQGRGKNKQNVFDDFTACAEFLIANKYTSPARLVSNGGSNGGLLTAATMLQRPDLFGAVITEVPVTDMFRFHLGTYGSAWMGDYGNPAVKEDFNTAAAYSPLHNVKPGAKYPPHLIMTADHDDRVLPWHAFKLAATLQAKSAPENLTLLRVEERAGHGAGKPLKKVIAEEAEAFAFIERAIGPVDQKKFKTELAEKQQKSANQNIKTRLENRVRGLWRKIKP